VLGGGLKGAMFQSGRRYLVFARLAEQPTNLPPLFAHLCGGTQQLDAASAWIPQLGQPRSPGARLVSGEVVTPPPQPSTPPPVTPSPAPAPATAPSPEAAAPPAPEAMAPQPVAPQGQQGCSGCASARQARGVPGWPFALALALSLRFLDATRRVKAGLPAGRSS